MSKSRDTSNVYEIQDQLARGFKSGTKNQREKDGLQMCGLLKARTAATSKKQLRKHPFVQNQKQFQTWQDKSKTHMATTRKGGFNGYG